MPNVVHALRILCLSDGVETVLHGIEDRWYVSSSDVAERYDEAYARYLELAAS